MTDNAHGSAVAETLRQADEDGDIEILESWDVLDRGDRIVYIGPDELPSDYAAPKPRAQPYRFLLTYHTGDPALEDKYGRRKILESDHPATDATNWRRALPEEVDQ